MAASHRPWNASSVSPRAGEELAERERRDLSLPRHGFWQAHTARSPGGYATALSVVLNLLHENSHLAHITLCAAMWLT